MTHKEVHSKLSAREEVEFDEEVLMRTQKLHKR